jgi:hypothetical protein
LSSQSSIAQEAKHEVWHRILILELGENRNVRNLKTFQVVIIFEDKDVLIFLELFVVMMMSAQSTNGTRE